MKIGNINNTMLFSFISLVYMIFFAFGFFTKKKIRTSELNIFTGLIISNIISLIVEILLVVFILTNNPLLDITLKIFNMCILLYVWMFGLYSYLTVRKNGEVINVKDKLFKLYVVFYLVCSFIILMLPVNINLEDYKQYSYGPSVNFLFVAIGTVVTITIGLLIPNIKKLKSRKCTPILLFIFLIGTNAIIQFIWPYVLLANSFFSFITFLMYFTVENPDLKMLDEVHKSKEISDNANEEKAMFLYNMTNDIRRATKEVDNIANEILFETENKKVDIEKVKDYARELKNSAARFNTMTNEILDISQVDSANIRVYNEKYNVKLIIKEFIGIYKKKCIEKNLDFRTSIASDIPDYLYGDSVGLKNVLSIILDNSIKYTEDGYIEFSVNTIMRRDVCRLIISIEDTGSGIKAENLEKIFSKKEEDTEEDRHNLDNNLYNAKRLITLMGGTIIPTSVYDKGTTIKIVLDQKVVSDTNNEITKYEEVYDKKKILLVDDNISSTKIVSKLLEDTNIELEIVSLGSECLDKIRNKEKYDLILLDEEMKPLDGITVMKKLKSIRSFNTKVVLLTRNNDYEYNDDYLKYGFSDYILKPLDKDKFLEKIDKCLK